MKYPKNTSRLMVAYKSGLTLPQWLLLHLLRRKALYLSEIAEQMDIHKTTARKFVRRLASAGYVEVVFSPAATGNIGAPFSALVTLTPEGVNILER